MMVYHWRLIDKKNFSPMCYNLIDSGLLNDCIQIYTDVIGGRAWITISVRGLKDE